MTKRKAYSKLMEEIYAGKFVYTGELEPEKIGDMDEIIEGAKKLVGHVVAANVTDIPQRFAYMNSLGPSYMIQEKAGLEAVCQMTCRDRNRLAMFADLLAAGALGIKNILALTGDHPSLGDQPEAKPVFDLDSASLTALIRKISDQGTDLNDHEIHNPPKFHVGVAINPGAIPLEPEILKLERKEAIGAEFAQTQVVFEIDKAKQFMQAIKHINIPTLVGIFPLKSYKIGQWMNQYVPGVSVPKELLSQLEELKKIEDKPRRNEKIAELNVEYYGEFIRELRKTTQAAGCHIMAVKWEELIPMLIEVAGV
ncbi:MAG: methylenetetrahydrofolate reductase [Candidatus Thorarchaeota archaeon]